MTLRLFASSLAVFVYLGSFAGLALADEEREDEPPKHESYFAISSTGGLLLPMGKMADGARQVDKTFTLDGRLGYVGSSGFGFDFGVAYAPLSRVGVTRQMLGLSVGPRFTIGHGAPRFWVSVGGGISFEYDADKSDKGATVNAAAGFELHFFSNGGLAIRTTYTRGFADNYNMVTATAGLVFTL